MDKEVKLLLNSLKCPICISQIDIIMYGAGRSYGYGCASDTDHYKALINKNTVSLDIETICFYDNNHKYQIDKYHNFTPIKTVITIYNADLQGVIYDNKQKLLEIRQDLFNLDKFNVDNAIKRIKTIFVFQ